MRRSCGREIIFDVAEAVKEYVLANNKQVGSLHSEMIARVKASETALK